MTTLVRVSHLDSHLPVEITVKSLPDNHVISTHLIATKGDEHTVYLHSGQYIEVKEISLVTS